MWEQKGARDASGLEVLLIIFRLFGGIQEYISFDLYENVLRWAISNGLLDSKLNG